MTLDLDFLLRSAAMLTRRSRSAGQRWRVAALAVSLILGGCATGSRSGGSAQPPASRTREPTRHVTLVLDFVPNAVHAGIYRALVGGYYRRAGIDLRIVQPASTSDTLNLIEAGHADFGIADGIDLAGLINAGGDAQGVMALVQRPLGGLISLSAAHFSSPRALVGRTVGITGVPSDLAVLDTELRHAGGDPRRVRTVNVGVGAASALLAGHLAAFTGYGPDDGVGLSQSGHPVTFFSLDANGGPAYPGLIVFTTRRRIAAEPALVRAMVAATVRGYRDTLARPQLGLDALLSLNPALARPRTSASLRAYLPLFAAGGAAVGALPPGGLSALSAWLHGHHLIRRPISAARLGTEAFLPHG